jgi:hypothetical protein
VRVTGLTPTSTVFTLRTSDGEARARICRRRDRGREHCAAARARRYGGPGWGLATYERGLPGRNGSWLVETQIDLIAAKVWSPALRRRFTPHS